jgi:hypothetical protein
LWQHRSGEFPLSPTDLRSFLDANSSGTGVAARASAIRFARRDSIFVPESNVIPTAKTFLHRYSCGEAHPGLCASLHSHIYLDALAFGSSLERYFIPDKVTGYFLLSAEYGFKVCLVPEESPD